MKSTINKYKSPIKRPINPYIDKVSMPMPNKATRVLPQGLGKVPKTPSKP
jgi:hypothetical protein